MAGAGSGRALDRPEEVLPEFDLVFAKGRAALEALATGAAVVVCDAHGLGPMVTTSALARLRALNFGVRLLPRRIERAAVVEEVRRYDAQDAAAVSLRVREEADLETALSRIEAIYARALAAEPLGDASPAGEMRAASRYLMFLAPALKSAWSVAQERDRLAGIQAELDRVRATSTWRLRDLLLGSRLVRALHRAVRGVA